ADPPRGGAGQRHEPRLGRVVGRRGRADAGGPGARRHSICDAAAATQVITPRRTQLVRVPNLQTFRSTIARLATEVRGSGFGVQGSVRGSGFAVRGSANPEFRTENPEFR